MLEVLDELRSLQLELLEFFDEDLLFLQNHVELQRDHLLLVDLSELLAPEFLGALLQLLARFQLEFFHLDLVLGVGGGGGAQGTS